MTAKRAYLLAAAVLVVVLACVLYFAVGRANASTVTAGDTVQLYYTGTLTNGTVFDSNVNGNVFSFVVGANQVIPGFEQDIMGMALDQNKTFTIPSDQAYGPVNSALIYSVPLSKFENETVKVGTIVSPANDPAYRGVVTAVNATNATVDFNSPLAGQALSFSVKVVGISKK